MCEAEPKPDLILCAGRPERPKESHGWTRLIGRIVHFVKDSQYGPNQCFTVCIRDDAKSDGHQLTERGLIEDAGSLLDGAL